MKNCSYYFPSVPIQQINRNVFTYHSKVYCDIKRWIVSLIILLQILMSSFQLNSFPFSVVMISFHALVYNLLWLYSKHYFLLGISLSASYFLWFSVVSFTVIVLSFIVLLYNDFSLPILHQILYNNSLILHRCNFPTTILSRLVYLLQIVFLYHKPRLFILFPFTNHCYKATSNITNLFIYKSILLLLSLIIPFLNHNLFHPIIILMASSDHYFKMNLFYLIYKYLSLPKS